VEQGCNRAPSAQALSFAPTANGDRPGTLTITDNAAGRPHQVTLDGNGTTPVPAVTLSPKP